MDGSFEKGMSHKGATYTNSNPLSADTKFEVCHESFALLFRRILQLPSVEHKPHCLSCVVRGFGV